MKPLCVCDICKKPITTLKDLRDLELVKTKSTYEKERVWTYEICMKCALSIEQEVMRRKRISDAKGGISE